MAHLIHQKTQQILAHNVIKTTRFLPRLKGLIGKNHLPPSDTLWIIPCKRGVHTFFMRFPLDLIFVDRFLKVTYIYQNIKPKRIIKPPGSFSILPPSYSVFEFSSFQDKWGVNAIRIQKGDQLYVED